MAKKARQLALATLLPVSGERIYPRIHQRTVSVQVSAAAQGLIVRQGLVFDREFTSIHEDALDIELGSSSSLGQPRLEAQNSFASPMERTLLDERGIVREGTMLKARDVLVSIVRATGDPPTLRDESERCPEEWAGMRVEAVEHFVRRGKTPEDGSERVVVKLRRDADLQPGDVLVHAGRPLGPVTEVIPDERMAVTGAGAPADLLLPAAVARRLGITAPCYLAVSKLKRCGQAAVTVQTTGPRSLITQMPLGAPYGRAQSVRYEQIGWLQARGLYSLIGEFVGLKADDWNRRVQKRQQPDAPSTSAPESLYLFRAELMGLGLNAELSSQVDHITVRLEPATADQIMSWSHGEVRKPETINYRTHRPQPAGLFCPEIFGPEEGPRNRRFGHITLPTPIIPYFWRYGSPSVLERLLNLSAANIDRILNCEVRAERCAGGVSLVEPDSPATPGAESLAMGAEAILALLQHVPTQRFPPALVGRVEALVQQRIPVLPADYRPLVLLSNGNWATSDLNDHYRRVINRANRLAKLRELNAPATIIWNEQRMLQLTVDGLYMNCFLPRRKRVMGTGKRPLVDMMTIAVDRLHEMSSKRVDWCGRARPVVISTVEPECLLVPRPMFTALQLDVEQPILLTRVKDRQGRFVALLPQPHAGDCFGISPKGAEHLGIGPWFGGSCVLHRPLTQAAQKEARMLVTGDPGAETRASAAPAWVDAPERMGIFNGLIGAALSGAVASLRSPRGLLLAGTGSIEDDS
jgi:hypothetical protein